MAAKVSDMDTAAALRDAAVPLEGVDDAATVIFLMMKQEGNGHTPASQQPVDLEGHSAWCSTYGKAGSRQQTLFNVPRFIIQVAAQIPESADWVLFGEASHGTHEFYQLRADVTKLLIEQRGFNAVATEAGAYLCVYPRAAETLVDGQCICAFCKSPLSP